MIDASALHYDGCIAISGGINDRLSGSRQLNVSPNPSNGIFQIQLEKGGKKLSELIIYNSSGKKIWVSNSPVSVPSQIDVSFLPDGVYFIRARSDQTWYSEKIILIR